mmetsp:Transcript_13578/g.28917  ORF Transcript_13578/g.28917 Transcript_13578/m.28917 type:complete len:224 (-) Transcript_13578:726-1397(-)
MADPDHHGEDEHHKRPCGAPHDAEHLSEVGHVQRQRQRSGPEDQSGEVVVEELVLLVPLGGHLAEQDQPGGADGEEVDGEAAARAAERHDHTRGLDQPIGGQVVENIRLDLVAVRGVPQEADDGVANAAEDVGRDNDGRHPVESFIVRGGRESVIVSLGDQRLLQAVLSSLAVGCLRLLLGLLRLGGVLALLAEGGVRLQISVRVHNNDLALQRVHEDGDAGH